MKRYLLLVVPVLLFIATICACGGSNTPITLTSIAVTPANPAVLVGETKQFTATGTHSDGTTADITPSVTWSSSSTAKVTIDSAGIATAVAAGTSVITATLGSVSGSTVPSMGVGDGTTIDAQEHANSGTAGADTAQDLTDLLIDNGITKAIIMQPPRADYDALDTSTADDAVFFSGQGDMYRFMYGGSELQPMLFAAGQTEEITAHSVYPNNTPGTEPITEAQVTALEAIRNSPGDYESIFQAKATLAAQSGLYIGFGELAPYHYSKRSGHPLMIYAADCDWLLWLSDLAEEYNMVLQIHMEATTEKVTELANLLDHNPATTIIWNHAGWSNTGDATAEVFSQMLANHPNLYILLKMRNYGSGEAAGDITNEDGSIKTEWLTLMTSYANRIMAESDAKFWQGGEAIADELEGSYPYLDAMLDQLPTETELRIREITARTLYGL